MNIETYNKSTQILKDISVTKNTINNLCKFLDKDKVFEVKLKTPQDSCLEFAFNQEELNYTISYLLGIYDLKLEQLEDEFDKL